MTKRVIQKKLIECNEDLDEISKKLCEVRTMEQTNDFDGYRDTSLEMARKAERFACRVRELVSDTVFYNKSEFMLDMSKAQGITIEKEEEWVKIVMPFLLPKRRVTHSCSFIIDPLKYAGSPGYAADVSVNRGIFKCNAIHAETKIPVNVVLNW